ncbi:MAG: hypothetical protein KDB47_17650 [Mycobacterium sp.]|nr:hypothetical protein [Mycobacterium sp.]
MSRRRRWFYITVGLFISVWMAVLMTVASTVIPDLYWFSYYSIDYGVGFVRRGLAGELVELFPDDRYFTGLRVLRWLPTIAYGGALVALAWVTATASGRSERRLMMAFLVPVLPFGFTFALFSARPDLLGAAALIGFALVLKRTGRARSVLIAGAAYGGITAVLALAHEATPLLFGLGALSAIAVLGRRHSGKTLQLCAVLALAPALLATVGVAVFGRRGVSESLCRSIPYGTVNWPASGRPTVGQILRGFRFDVEYHDWICRNIVPLYDQSIADAARYVADIGPALLAAATAIGIALLAASVLAISQVSGVRFARMLTLLRARPLWVLVGLALFIPVFMTGVDWIRWWVTIALDIGVVFLLFANGEPEVDDPPTRRTRTTFALALALLALFPLGILPGFGAAVPI